MAAVNYDWDPVFDCVTEEFDDAGSPIIKYSQQPQLFGNIISQRKDDTNSSWFHFDVLGTTRVLTDANQASTDSAIFSAYGERKSLTGGTSHRFEFLGQWGYISVSTIDSINIRSRDYKPSLISWLSSEKTRSLYHIDTYAYCSNTPVQLIDPTGMSGVDLRELPGPSPGPGDGGSGGTQMPGTEGRYMNCLGAAIGKKSWIKWPGLGPDCKFQNWNSARYSVPQGCRLVDCSGIDIRHTPCKEGETELIVFLYRYVVMRSPGIPYDHKYECDFHAVGRECFSAPCTWYSKQDKLNCIDRITDPLQSCYDAYPGTKSPLVTLKKLCFCCDRRLMGVTGGVINVNAR